MARLWAVWLCGVLPLLGCAEVGEQAPPDLSASAADLTIDPIDWGEGEVIDLLGNPIDDLSVNGLVDSLSADLTIVGTKGVGEPCGADTECLSALCKPVVAGASSVCVSSCTSQSDCVGQPAGFFCEPISLGSTAGYCIPQSPTHCASCTGDGDCGSLAERCFQGPGDIAAACHIDCSISGANGCPADYTCSSVTVGGATRRFCLPNNGQCLEALGGFCDRVAAPQSCSRSNSAGTCLGQRPCLAGARRYDRCTATVPQYKVCGQMDPAGCTVLYDANAMNQPDNCGACGRVCASVANGTRDCPSGTCAVGTCNTPYANCDTFVTNGCESNTNTDVNNCGLCGKKCPDVANGAKACVNGQCTVASCGGDWVDCNGNSSDGCETNVKTDVNRCGSCSKVCDNVANAEKACTAGVCSIGQCTAGYSDCNGGYWDGCEINLMTDVSNCGTCGKQCSGATNATAACTDGVCGFACAPGFSNCDGSASNGCETNGACWSPTSTSCATRSSAITNCNAYCTSINKSCFDNACYKGASLVKGTRRYSSSCGSATNYNYACSYSWSATYTNAIWQCCCQ